MAPMTSEAGDDLGTPGDRPARRGRGVALGVGIGAVLLGGYALTVVAVSGQDVASGTTVRGVEIGGMSTQEAVATLESELGDEATAPIPVIAAGTTSVVDPTEAGLAVDWEATVRQASGLILNPVTLWSHIQGQIEVEPITTTDPEALDSALEEVALTVATDPVEPEITYSKKAVATLEPGAVGASLDIPGSADAVSAAYFPEVVRTVELPTDEIPTEVSAEEAERVFSELAEPAVALPAPPWSRP
jgi:hypothetical protein